MIESGVMIAFDCQRVFQSHLLTCNGDKYLNYWSLGKQLILFPLNVNVSLGCASGNIEILRKQNNCFRRDQYFMINTIELRTLYREKHTLLDEYFAACVVFFRALQTRAIKDAKHE